MQPIGESVAGRLASASVAPGARASLRFEGVCKSYRGRSVLRDVSFDVHPGSVTAIAGINGAGKSTLLRCLLDFQEPDAGRIFIDGRDHEDINARQALAWLPERFVPPAHLTARECLQWLGGLRPGGWDASRAESLAGALGLDAAALDARVRELSKGMTQKLGLLAIGLAPNPTWILDEPMSGLDPVARRQVARLIDMARDCGRTVLFTTHGLRDLPARCDRLVVLHEGSIRFDGAPGEFGARHHSGDLEEAFVRCIESGALAQGRVLQ
jgi:ABC-2 type transport system ATP-binding protein